MAIKNLTTARVLLVDDTPAEAIPILIALGNIGVGCVYVKGDKYEELPDPPIDGIRLVFLDMRLAEGGDQKTVLSKTISVLKRCIPKNTMPLVVVCWTKHEEDIKIFKKMAVKEIPGLKQGFIVGMIKPRGKNPDKWKGILKQIRIKLKPYDALGLVWQWENILHGATTETSQMLVDVSANMVKRKKASSDDWQDAMFKVCRELVRAETGKITDEATTSNALFRIINEIAIDRIQNTALIKPFDSCAKLVPPEKPALDREYTSQLNKMIILEPTKENDTSCAPGAMFISKTSRFPARLRKLLGIRNIEPAEILHDPRAHKDCKDLKKEESKLLEKAHQNPGDDITSSKLKDIQARIDDFHDKLLKQCRELLIEISPTCDYAQGKRPIARFLYGLAIPVEIEKCIKNGEYIHKFESMMLPSRKGIWALILSSHHVYSVANIETNKKMLTATCRLRSHALSDLRIWTAFRNARPGSISIRESSG